MRDGTLDLMSDVYSITNNWLQQCTSFAGDTIYLMCSAIRYFCVCSFMTYTVYQWVMYTVYQWVTYTVYQWVDKSLLMSAVEICFEINLDNNVSISFISINVLIRRAFS